MRRSQLAHTGTVVSKQRSHLRVQKDIARVEGRVGYLLPVQEREAVRNGARHIVPLRDQFEPERERLLCLEEELLQAGWATWCEERIRAYSVGAKPKCWQYMRVRSLRGREDIKRETHLDEGLMRLA